MLQTAKFSIEGKSDLFFERALLLEKDFSYFAALFGTCPFLYPFGDFGKRIALGNQVWEHCNNPFINLVKGQVLYGYLGYDLKNTLENLSSENPRLNTFPDCLLFEPEVELVFTETELTIRAWNPELWWTKLISMISTLEKSEVKCGELKELTGKVSYEKAVNQLKTWIEDGWIYEANYCIGFKGDCWISHPISLWWDLVKQHPKPFAGMLKAKGLYMLGASPERFLKKEGKKLISQPIKGTKLREASKENDAVRKVELLLSEKEQAENRMITDLVRNDLAKSAKTGTVTVPEFLGLYSFTDVHQLISTVVAEVDGELSLGKIIGNAFPMGSMTGAPKIEVMKRIEQLENFRRGIYSGAFGYFTKEGDFDLNVVIRSLFYDSDLREVSFAAGGAITIDSDPLAEYEECLLKTKLLRNLLGLKPSE